MSKRKSHTNSSSIKNDENYGDEDYWDIRYKNNINHTWYFDYDTLKPLLEKVLLKKSNVLEIGCGDAPLCDGIIADSHEGLVIGIDFSMKIIETLIAKQNIGSKTSSSSSSSVEDPNYHSLQPTYQYMDARKLEFESHSFDIIFDKGTCDAMLSDSNQTKAFQNVKEILSESFRVLRKGVVLLSNESTIHPTTTSTATGTYELTYEPSYFVLISHMHPESSEFQDFYTHCLVPATASVIEPSNAFCSVITGISHSSAVNSNRTKLKAQLYTETSALPNLPTQFSWTIDAHVSDQGENHGPTVYIISCRPLRLSRRLSSVPSILLHNDNRRSSSVTQIISMNVHSHV